MFWTGKISTGLTMFALASHSEWQYPQSFRHDWNVCTVEWKKCHGGYQSIGQVKWMDVANVHASHYDDVIIGAIASQITSLTIVYSIVYSDADQRKHQSSASLAFVRGIRRGPVNSPHKWSVTRKMFPFDDVIMCNVNPDHFSIKIPSYQYRDPREKDKTVVLWEPLYP